LKKSLVLGNENTRGSILLTVGGAGGIGIVGSLRLANAGSVQVHLCQGLCYLSIIVEDDEVIIPGVISMYN
jgi:hypothetical protein